MRDACLFETKKQKNVPNNSNKRAVYCATMCLCTLHGAVNPYASVLGQLSYIPSAAVMVGDAGVLHTF